MSPEQADFQITDKRSDIIFRRRGAGQPAARQKIFKGENAEESRERIMR